MKHILLTSVLMMFSNFAAGDPLPENSEQHFFFAITECGEAKVFSWYTPEGGFVMPVGKITSQEILDTVLEARDKAEEHDNAYVIKVESDKCPRI